MFSTVLAHTCTGPAQNGPSIWRAPYVGAHVGAHIRCGGAPSSTVLPLNQYYALTRSAVSLYLYRR